MLGRSTVISIFFVSSREIVRADFERKSNSPKLLIRESIDVESNLSESLQLVLEGHPKPGRKSIILSTGFWSQIVLLPRMSVNGLVIDELLEALKFEAETLSGIEIDEVAIGAEPLSIVEDQQAYWVTAWRQVELEAANRLLEQSGSRQIEFGHPAGVTLNRSAAIDPTVEVWGNTAFLFVDPKNGLRQIKPVNSFLEAYRSADSSNNSEGVPSILVGPESTSLEIAGHPETYNLSDSTQFENWLGNVAQSIRTDGQVSFPRIRVCKRRATTPTRHLVSGALALIALAFCVWHSTYVKQRNEHLRRQISLMKQPAADKKKYDSQLLNVFQKRSEVENEDAALVDDVKRIQFFLEHQNDRFTKLLSLLANLRTPQLVVTQLGGSDDGVIVTGVSLNPESAQALALQLREEAVFMGWVVDPATQTGQEKMTSGGPWDFEILLTDTGPFETPPKPRRTAQFSKSQTQEF